MTIVSDYASAARAALDPVGTWSCVVWGHPEFGDERVLLNFDANGIARLARVENDAVPAWSGLTPWVREDRQMRFSDPRTGRQFTADLRRENLGGNWRTLTTTGGWWCAVSDVVVVPETTEERAAALPPVLPRVTATPRYPIAAIREAKQGRVVTCFLVDAEGVIVEPEIIELSDEVFREPILVALSRSRYEARQADSALRPSCRSYTFSLDRLAQYEIESESESDVRELEFK
ncbi:MAG TPA: energy transducer TonB [Gammaproteobacteria bacterium]|nr:energy transducer TonB [Gammaproteobacteria bacterium]